MLGSRAGAAGHNRSLRLLFGHGGIYTLATVAPILAGFLITPLVTRSLGQSQYGVVALGLATIQLGQVVASAGLPASITRHVALEESGRRGAAGQVAFNAVLVLPLVLAAVVALAAAASPNWAPASLSVVLLFASISAALLAVFTSTQALVRGLSQVGTFVRQSAGIALLPPLVGLVAATLVSPTAIVYASGLAAGHLVITGAVVGRTLRRNPPAWSRRELIQGLRIGLPTVPHQLATIAATSLLVVLAGVLEGKDAAGRMQLALIVGTAPILVIGAFNNSWAVEVYKMTNSARRAYVERSTFAVTAFSVVLSLSAGAVAPEVTEWLAPVGEHADQMASASILVAAAAPFMVLYLANMHLIFTAGTTARLAITTPMALSIALSVGLVARSLFDSDLTVVVMSASVCTFYVAQGILAAHLRRRAGWPQLDLDKSIVVAAVGLVASCGLVTVQPPVQSRAAMVALLWIAVLLVAGVLTRRNRGVG